MKLKKKIWVIYEENYEVKAEYFWSMKDVDEFIEKNIDIYKILDIAKGMFIRGYED